METIVDQPPLSQAEQLAAEQAQLAILLNEGGVFTTPKRSPLRFFGAKERTWKLPQPYLATLDRLANEWIRLDFDELALHEEGFVEAKRLLHHNALRCARIVAIALLNECIGARWLVGPLSHYLLRRINPDKLLTFVALINQLQNLESFIVSIRLMSMTPRKSQPTRIEKQAGDGQPA